MQERKLGRHPDERTQERIPKIMRRWNQQELREVGGVEETPRILAGRAVVSKSM